MAKKKVGLSNLAFNRIDPYGQQAAEEQRGAAPATTYHIDQIFPDPSQPRRLLPDGVADRFFGGELSPAGALAALRDQARRPGVAPALVEAVDNLRALAHSIAEQGQINPITIRPLADGEWAPDGVEYYIVTGERRWWSHVWLTQDSRAIKEGDEERHPDRIKASVTARGANIRAHQLIENLQREDISLLERAYGLLALYDEVSAARGKERGSWKEIEELLGMSRAYRTRTLKVLDLSDDAQQLVADHDLSERAIRPIAGQLADRPDLQIRALEQLLAWQQAEEEMNVTSRLREYVDELLHGKPQKQKRGGRMAAPFQRFRSRLGAAARAIRTLPEDEWSRMGRAARRDPELVEELRYVRQVIDRLLGEGE